MQPEVKFFAAYIVVNQMGSQYIVPIDQVGENPEFGMWKNEPKVLASFAAIVPTTEKLTDYITVEGWFVRCVHPGFNTHWLGPYDSEKAASNDYKDLWGSWTEEEYLEYAASWTNEA